MADDNTIIEGSVKFRDGKKWKSRWCVMRKLSPVADCVHVQLYRDARARAGGGGCKAALSLQQYVGLDAGFPLDKQCHTLALLCADTACVLAFECRERLLAWQGKAARALGPARAHLVQVAAGARVPPGPARLLLAGGRAALAAAVPPRLIAVWDLKHLRRYGVVEGRFCLEGGSQCGKGEGLHVLITDRAEEIARDFDLASQGRLPARGRPLDLKTSEGASSPPSHKAYRPDTRLSELDTIARSLELRAQEGARAGEVGPASPCWPSAERYRDMGHGDTASVTGPTEGDRSPWDAAGNVSLERCVSCISKLGALSRSSTAALTPGAKHFSPAWTMEALGEAAPEPDTCRCPPPRPHKPAHLARPRAPDPPHNTRVGPYLDYDVPKLASVEVDEYYDTPKRLKECLDDELFKMTRSATTGSMTLRKRCGCVLRLGGAAPRAPAAAAPPRACPCRRVTDWAHSWIRLPYCSRAAASADQLAPDKENVRPPPDTDALYATVDLSRKTRRKSHPIEPLPRSAEIDDGPLANYENLNFALSLENYENAKDLLRRAGVTRAELNAIGANLRAARLADAPRRRCAECGLPPPRDDDYLTMEPKSLEGGRPDAGRAPPAGYAPMSPVTGFAFDALERPARNPIDRLLEEKSASNPALFGPDDAAAADDDDAADARAPRARVERRKRSSSADSSRFLDEFDDGARSSTETLRDAALDARAPSPCDCAAEHKHSDADSSEASRRAGAGPPPAGNRDSSSSNDSGVSSCSRRGAAARELPATTHAARRHYRWARRAAAAAPHAPPAPRRAASSDRAGEPPPPRARDPGKSSSAEAEVPLLVRPRAGVADAHSTSSGTSDMSDYIETLSVCSSHSSTDTPITMRVARQTSTLRPRSGREYQPLPARLACELRAPPDCAEN